MEKDFINLKEIHKYPIKKLNSSVASIFIGFNFYGVFSITAVYFWSAQAPAFDASSESGFCLRLIINYVKVSLRKFVL